VEPKRRRLRRNRDVLLAALDESFGDDRTSVTWNRPAGGFFLTLSVPSAFGMTEARRCAETHGVLVLPVQCLSLRGDRRRQIRLSFASVGDQALRDGVHRLAGFVNEEARARAVASAVEMAR
jgi:(S)-3,5-dihydroxyphenylglycine transaminase